MSQRLPSTILFAEDNDAMRELGCRILTNAGYNLIIAEDGLNALHIFETNAETIDLAILDVIMPRMNGRLVFDRIRQLNPSLPVLFCSAFNRHMLGEMDLTSEPGVDLISKPYEPHILLQHVNELLHGRRKQ